jgi:hypothetical protein
MNGRHFVSVLALAAAITLSASCVQCDPPAQEQANATKQATGNIAGRIRTRSGLGFNVSLSIPGIEKPVAFTTVGVVDDDGKFTLEGIQPGIYQLDISSFGGCGILPLSEKITIRAGETLRLKAKLRVARNARCE